MSDDDLIRRGDARRVADEVFDQCENVHGDDRGAFAAAEVGARIAALPAVTVDDMNAAIAVKGGTIHAPTQWAYDQACTAIEKHRNEAAALRERVARLEGAGSERPDAPAHIVEYTNYRGETARRCIIPIRMWWGSTEWHPEEQWMLTAWDLDKNASRDFAWQDMRPVQNPGTSTAIRALPAADARAEALKEALQALRGAGSFGRTAAEKHAALEQYCLCRDAILALLTEKPHDRA